MNWDYLLKDYFLKQKTIVSLPTQIDPNVINELIEFGAKMKEDEMKEGNNVNSPSHYNQGSIETIDIIKGTMSAEEFKGFLKGNIIKYVSRAEFKGKETEDLQKARWYLDRWIRELEE